MCETSSVRTVKKFHIQEVKKNPSKSQAMLFEMMGILGRFSDQQTSFFFSIFLNYSNFKFVVWDLPSEYMTQLVLTNTCFPWKSLDMMHNVQYVFRSSHKNQALGENPWCIWTAGPIWFEATRCRPIIGASTCPALKRCKKGCVSAPQLLLSTHRPPNLELQSTTIWVSGSTTLKMPVNYLNGIIKSNKSATCNV